MPFAICLGIDNDDWEDIGLLLGLKTVVNEFVAYQKLLSLRDESKISVRFILQPCLRISVLYRAVKFKGLYVFTV